MDTINCVSCGNPHKPEQLAAYTGDRGVCYACLEKSAGESLAKDLVQIADAAKRLLGDQEKT